MVAGRVFEIRDAGGEGDDRAVGGDRVAFGAAGEDLAARAADPVDQRRLPGVEVALVDVRFAGCFARQRGAEVGRRRGEDDVATVGGERQRGDPRRRRRFAGEPVGAADELNFAAVEILDEALDRTHRPGFAEVLGSALESDVAGVGGDPDRGVFGDPEAVGEFAGGGGRDGEGGGGRFRRGRRDGIAGAEQE